MSEEQLIQTREALRALRTRQDTHNFRISQLESAALRSAAATQGPEGPPGPSGPVGPMPRHQWSGTALAFENPDGTFDQPVDLQGPRGKNGKSTGAAGFGGPVAVAATPTNSYFPGGW